MNCYLCLVETGIDQQPAHVLCQRCMAGVCKSHLVEIMPTPVVGPAGNFGRLHFLCQRCHHQLHKLASSALPRAFSLQASQRRETGLLHGWLAQLWKPAQSRQKVLPTPEEAVETVEHYLKRRRS